MRFVYIVLSLLLLSTCISAQSNFKRGYIITNSHDSIVGLIDFRTDVLNGRFCRFKQSDKAPEQIYYPGDIFAYRFIDEGKYYISHSITIGNVSQKVFLEYLINGAMNLYHYNDADNNLEYYFFETENKEMIPITKKPDEIIDSRLKEDNKYLGILNYVFGEYPEIKKDLNHTSFSRSSMIHLVKEYHELTCSPGDVCVDFENDYKKQYIKFNFSAYGGAQVQKYTFKREDFYNFDPTSSLFPVVGGIVEVSLPRLASPISVSIDLALSGIKGEVESTLNDYYRKYRFDALNIMGKANLKYTYPHSKYRPTIEGGISLYKLFNASESQYSEYRTPVGVTTSTQNKDFIRNSFSGFNCALGLDYVIKKDKALFFRISYEKVSHDDVIDAGLLKIGYIF